MPNVWKAIVRSVTPWLIALIVFVAQHLGFQYLGNRGHQDCGNCRDSPDAGGAFPRGQVAVVRHLPRLARCTFVHSSRH